MNSTDPIIIQERLRADKTLTAEALAASLKVDAKRHSRFANLVQFKYDQIESDMSDPAVQQCRSLILDEARNWACVARPFDKFFNLEEPGAAALDWKSARCLEKLDGSLCILYHYSDPKQFISEWLVATSGRPDASGNVNGLEMTFESLFWKTFLSTGLEVPGHEPHNTNLTYLFELMSPYNRVVVDNGAQPKVTLIGARHKVTGEEYWPEDVAPLYNNWRSVREFSFGGVVLPQSIQDSFEAMDPLKQEGYVVVDKTFQRVKVKHPGYVLAHQLRSAFSTKNALEAIRRGEAPEILAHFPEMKAEMDRITLALAEFKSSICLEWDRLSAMAPQTQKEFALEAVKTPMRGAPLFFMRSGKGTLQKFVQELPLDKLVEVLGLKERPPAVQEDAQ